MHAGLDKIFCKPQRDRHSAVVDVDDEPRPRHVFERVRLRLSVV
jgi:hypothetical protein